MSLNDESRKINTEELPKEFVEAFNKAAKEIQKKAFGDVVRDGVTTKYLASLGRSTPYINPSEGGPQHHYEGNLKEELLKLINHTNAGDKTLSPTSKVTDDTKKPFPVAFAYMNSDGNRGVMNDDGRAVVDMLAKSGLYTDNFLADLNGIGEGPRVKLGKKKNTDITHQYDAAVDKTYRETANKILNRSLPDEFDQKYADMLYSASLENRPKNESDYTTRELATALRLLIEGSSTFPKTYSTPVPVLSAIKALLSKGK